jgi:hypothetical protein
MILVPISDVSDGKLSLSELGDWDDLFFGIDGMDLWFLGFVVMGGDAMTVGGSEVHPTGVLTGTTAVRCHAPSPAFAITGRGTIRVLQGFVLDIGIGIRGKRPHFADGIIHAFSFGFDFGVFSFHDLLMGTCIFVASGLSFDVDAYVATSPLKPATTFKKSPNNLRVDSGFTVIVSQGDEEPGLLEQFKDAMAFLERHKKEMERMKLLGMDNHLLDFGVLRQPDIQQAVYIPPEITSMLGRYGMGLIVSVVDKDKATGMLN